MAEMKLHTLSTPGGEIELLKPTGPVIGVMSNVNFTALETRMEKGDDLLVFTDGIPDSKNPQSEFYGHERLENFLKQQDPSSTERVNRLGRELEAFISTAEQFDDITVMSIRRL